MAYNVNLGTLLRTCDAVGACMAVPSSPHYREALAVGDTLRRRPCIHWLDCERERWIEAQRALGWRIVAVELAEARSRCHGFRSRGSRRSSCSATSPTAFPEEMVDAADTCVEIPMVGAGRSLNVAVAGSLVLYRLAGLA